MLELQLKSTSSASSRTATGLSIQMDRHRFEYFATPSPTIHKIVVAMWMPKNPEDWCEQFDDHFGMRHCAYWVNIAGSTSSARTPTVHFPYANVFDDVSLCRIVEKLGRGDAP